MLTPRVTAWDGKSTHLVQWTDESGAVAHTAQVGAEYFAKVRQLLTSQVGSLVVDVDSMPVDVLQSLKARIDSKLANAQQNVAVGFAQQK